MHALPNFWVFSGISVTLVAAVAIAPHAQATSQRAFGLGGLMCAAALMVSLAVILNKPYAGETVVSPAPIERATRAMGART